MIARRPKAPWRFWELGEAAEGDVERVLKFLRVFA
jgi:hypothetical protein